MPLSSVDLSPQSGLGRDWAEGEEDDAKLEIGPAGCHMVLRNSEMYFGTLTSFKLQNRLMLQGDVNTTCVVTAIPS